MLTTVKPRERTKNVYLKNGKPLVARVPHFNGDYLPTTVTEALDLLGGLDEVITSGDEVFIKPNFNCSYEIPMSTDLTFLGAVIEILQDAGAKVTVGESSGMDDAPTAGVIERLKVLPMLKRYGVPFINFDEHEWLNMEVPGKYFESIQVPRSIYEANKRVYLANIRCHHDSRFTASLKLGVGFISMEDRDVLHSDKSLLEARIADLNLGWQPDIALIDGRRTTTNGDGRGKYFYPNVILASADMVALDTEAVQILRQFPGDNKLNVPQERMHQLLVAKSYGLGTNDYSIVEAPGRTETVQQRRF